MQDTTYNGWTNYATWRVNLECIDGINPHDMDWPTDIDELEDALENHVEDYILETTNEGIGRDYALAFLHQVNWREIAEHMVDAYSDENAEA